RTQSCNQTKDRGFAAAGGSENADEFALIRPVLDLKSDVLNGGRFARSAFVKGLGDVVKFDDVIGRGVLSHAVTPHPRGKGRVRAASIAEIDRWRMRERRSPAGSE